MNNSKKYYDESYYENEIVKCDTCAKENKIDWRPKDFWKCKECVKGFIDSEPLISDRLGIVMANVEFR